MKHRKLFAICITLILLIILVRVVYINNKYPSQQNHVYTMEQGLVIGDCQIKPTKFQIGDSKICKEVLDDYDYDNIFRENSPNRYYDNKVILVTVEVKNNSDKDFNPAKDLLITSKSTANGVYGPLFQLYNKNDYTVKSNSQAQVVLTFIISNSVISKEKWNNIENEEFALSYADVYHHDLLLLK